MTFSRIAKVVWGVLAGIIACLIAFVVVRFFTPATMPTAPSGTITAPTTPHTGDTPQPAETPTTEVPTLDTTPVSTPSTEPPLPKNGDERGCPADYNQVDESDPFCKKKMRDAIYQQHYATNDAFRCNDGRNKGLDAKNLDKFVPCINSSFRLEITGTNKMMLYQTTSSKVRVQSSKPSSTNARANGLDWLVWQQFKNDGYAIVMDHNPDMDYFGMYVRTGATGDWKRADSSYWFTSGQEYQVVVFWNDPFKPDGDAPLPPFFNWKKVAKH